MFKKSKQYLSLDTKYYKVLVLCSLASHVSHQPGKCLEYSPCPCNKSGRERAEEDGFFFIE